MFDRCSEETEAKAKRFDFGDKVEIVRTLENGSSHGVS